MRPTQEAFDTFPLEHDGEALDDSVSGADIQKAANLEGESILSIAARANSLEVLKLLLAAGAHKHVRVPEVAMALQATRARGDIDLADILLQRGADPNICGRSTLNPLQTACQVVNLPIVRMLLNAGADVNLFGKSVHLV